MRRDNLSNRDIHHVCELIGCHKLCQKGTGIDRPGTEINTVTIPVGGGDATFYFYNPQTVAQGKTQFQRKWGRRPLEDDWRRRKKELSTFNEPMDDEMADAEAEGAEGVEGAAVEGNGAVYFCAVGGAGALASKCITSCEVIAFDDLGCESVKRLEFSDFPLTVAIDCHGGNLFQT